MSQSELTERITRLEEQLARIVDLLESPPQSDPLMSVTDVARRLNVSNRTVETLISTGEIKAIRVKGQRRFDREAVESYIRRCAENRYRRRARKG